MYGEMKTSQSKWLVVLVAVCLLAALAVAVIVYLLLADRPLVLSSEASSSATLSSVNTPAVDNYSRPIHVLVIGHGGSGHDGADLADTVMVAQIVPMSKKLNLYNLPRDLWVKLPFAATADSSDDFYSKINAVFAFGQSSHQYQHRSAEFQGKNGGGVLMKKVVSPIIGQEIDYFLAVDFTTFKKVINLIAPSDGLLVNSPFAFVDNYYPLEDKQDDTCGLSEEQIADLTASLHGFDLEKQFPCRYETVKFPAGEQYLSADELLKYVRSRHADGKGGGDFSRSARQQAVLEAVKKRLLSVQMLPKLPVLIMQIATMINTDIDIKFVTQALQQWSLAEFTLHGQVISDQNLLTASRAGGGQYVLLPKLGQDNYDDIHALVREGLTASSSTNQAPS